MGEEGRGCGRTADMQGGSMYQTQNIKIFKNGFKEKTILRINVKKLECCFMTLENY